jgi:hypothetical protein
MINVVIFKWLHRIRLLKLLILVTLISSWCLVLLISQRSLELLLCLPTSRLVHSTVLKLNVLDISKELRVKSHVWQGGVHIAGKKEHVVHLGSKAWIKNVNSILELRKRAVLLASL